MTVWTLVKEAARTAWAQKIPSLLILVVTAAMSVSALATVGQAAAGDRAIGQQLDQAGARVLTVTDISGQGLITPAVLDMARTTTGVELAVALTSPRDVSNGEIPGSSRVPVWQVSDPDLVTRVSRGREPQPGEAIASAQAMDTLRLGQPAGWVQVDQFVQYPVVAAGATVQGFEDLAAGLVVRAGPGTQYHQLRVIIDDVSDVPGTQRAILAIIGTSDPTQLQVDSPRGIAMASQLITGQIAQNNRMTFLLILGAGAFFVAVVALTDVLLHRRDLGRRRALGITRTSLTALTTLKTGIPAGLGALTGAAGTALWSALRGLPLPPDFTAATAVLATLTALAATVVPAAWAARRDPVSVLRTP